VSKYNKDQQKNVAMEEAKYFHIAVVQFLTFFILVIFINFISWVLQEGGKRSDLH
jgi:hypothetical protein